MEENKHTILQSENIDQDKPQNMILHEIWHMKYHKYKQLYYHQGGIEYCYQNNTTCDVQKLNLRAVFLAVIIHS